jgi:Reverse transcriptase (RNA-dependent DNA polymerase)
VQELRRSTRNRRANTKYFTNEFILLVDNSEPECFEEALESEHKNEWLEAMQNEMKSLHENNTFELVKLSRGKKVLKNKWVYQVKFEGQEAKLRYKTRLVVKRFYQKKGVNFEEIFSPVVKMSSIQVVLSLAASLDLKIEQLDIKIAFLHGDLEEELYMEQPGGFCDEMARAFGL